MPNLEEFALNEDILSIRTPLVAFHVLRDASELYLIDTGFWGGINLLRRALKRVGWDQLPIRGIMITHGHLDHILNAAAISKETGAWIAAPRLDADHYAGNPKYVGAARIAGLLEAIGRPLLRFEPFTPHKWIDNGTAFDFWHGLRAIHLPGHTNGHTSFYCEKRKLLFSADLFASYRHFSHFPPAIFNSDPSTILDSVATALDLDLEGVIPNHGNPASPKEHLGRLQMLFERATKASITNR